MPRKEPEEARGKISFSTLEKYNLKLSLDGYCASNPVLKKEMSKTYLPL
jgi:hypothetical protein